MAEATANDGGGAGRKRKLARKGKREEKKRRKPSARLSSSVQKALGLQNPSTRARSDAYGDFDEDEEERMRQDVFEYEEAVPEEEARKNRRFDPVENFEYELPEDFKDEDVPSDDEERHLRMLEGITGMPGQAFRGQEKKRVVFLGVQGHVSDGKISIQDLLDPLHGKPGYNNLKKRINQLDKKPMAVHAPLPKVEREKLERQVAYKHSKKDITKWEPLVKKNREASTLYFDKDVDLGFSTVGAIASEFEPRSEFEKKMASLVHDPEVTEAHWKDGEKLLELNKFTVEDVRDHQHRLAKMRSLLFRHEMKAKRIKKIKSKTYHRILKKERLKSASTEMELDPETGREQARKQEFKRAEERMTLKHKNSSKWAKRILKRGLNVQDEGTRAAIAEQLHQHALLTRKMNSVKDISSSDETSDDDNDEEESDNEGVSKLLNKAKEKTLEVMEDNDEMPKSGLFALPFMERGLKKRKEAAYEEARIALQEYDSSLKQLEAGNEAEDAKMGHASGRKIFGAQKKKPQETIDRINKDSTGKGSDTEDDYGPADAINDEADNELLDVKIGPELLHGDSVHQESLFKSFDDIVKDPGPKTSYDVAIFASDSWRKMKSENVVSGNKGKQESILKDRVLHDRKVKEIDLGQDGDSDSDEEMVDGVMSSGPNPEYQLPSQAELIHQAFAGDDVEAEFEEDKFQAVNKEVPQPEKPVLVPGWGQWTDVQKKKGIPSWMQKEYEDANRKREEALKRRKDAHLNHVIISEIIDKKAQKLQAKALPFPFTSKEVYEQSIRMPIGPEFNPAISVGTLNRPAVVKRAGIIIDPIKYEEVDPHEKPDEPRKVFQNKTTSNTKGKTQKMKSSAGKSTKKASSEKKKR